MKTPSGILCTAIHYEDNHDDNDSFFKTWLETIMIMITKSGCLWPTHYELNWQQWSQPYHSLFHIWPILKSGTYVQKIHSAARHLHTPRATYIHIHELKGRTRQVLQMTILSAAIRSEGPSRCALASPRPNTRLVTLVSMECVSKIYCMYPLLIALFSFFLFLRVVLVLFLFLFLCLSFFQFNLSGSISLFPSVLMLTSSLSSTISFHKTSLKP